MPGDVKFFGKYRGTVLNNIDPMKQGRIMCMVPDVLGVIPTTWALPCLPFTGIASGMYVVPAIQAGVWVEFEHGDPDYPIWTGSWFATAAEVPPMATATPPGTQCFVVTTMLANTFMVSDTPGPTGGIMLQTNTGAMIKIDDTGIIIQNGKGAMIAMQGPTITINGGALVIT